MRGTDVTSQAKLDFDAWRSRVVERLARDHQRPTPQRLLVAETLFHHGHQNLDELHQHARRADPTLGYATVYRTLKLLEKCGLVNCSNFGDGTARYEINLHAAEHHDHMICTGCGRIVEFENDAIEAMQRQIALAHGFELTSHRMDLYGVCPRCQRRK
jgi:Fur family ferric uptake transcriptional regulator